MQKGRFAAFQYAPRHDSHQAAGIALPAPVGMGAHSADFRESVQLQSFARHRHQLAVLANTDEAAQLMGAAEEGAGLGQDGQRQHFVSITIAQRDHIETRVFRRDRLGQHLMNIPAHNFGGAWRRRDVGCLDNPDDPVLRDQRGQRCKIFRS